MKEYEKIELLKEIKVKMQQLQEEKEALENQLDEFVIYQNKDETWTRFTKIDNIKELEKGTFFRPTAIKRFTTKIENLKNKPKELN